MTDAGNQVELANGGAVIIFDPDREVSFCVAALETYAFARREAVVIDALTLVAAVEHVDRLIKRPAYTWARRIQLQIPVFEPLRWQDPLVSDAIHQTLSFLTGDAWSIEFVKRSGDPIPKPQDTLPLPSETRAVIAYSDGLDSRAVAALANAGTPGRLLRVQVGSKAFAGDRYAGLPVPFTGVPYQLRSERRRVESSARSRGFKFAMFAGIAAYLADANEVVVPESGQGVFGPAMMSVMHGYADFRNHPLFTAKVERLLKSLLGHNVRFEFPRLWSTKAETLREYVSSIGDSDWMQARSCWQDSRWSSINGKRRQCGVCAACLLRRMSVHAAGLGEPDIGYVCENLRAPTLGESAPLGHDRTAERFRSYAIAGIRQLDDFGALLNNSPVVSRHATVVADVMGLPPSSVETNLFALLEKHSSEWQSFVDEIGPCSFFREWIGGGK